MTATSALVANEDEFRLSHRRKTRDFLYVFLASITVSSVPVAGMLFGRATGLTPQQVLFALLVVSVLWTVTAFAVLSLRRHVRFVANPAGFVPDTLPVSWAWKRPSLIHYEEVAAAEHSSGVAGYWWIALRLKTGEEVRINKRPEVPNSAYEFLLANLQSRGIPARIIN